MSANIILKNYLIDINQRLFINIKPKAFKKLDQYVSTHVSVKASNVFDYGYSIEQRILQKSLSKNLFSYSNTKVALKHNLQIIRFIVPKNLLIFYKLHSLKHPSETAYNMIHTFEDEDKLYFWNRYNFEKILSNNADYVVGTGTNQDVWNNEINVPDWQNKKAILSGIARQAN